jgi:hypothetical protein
MNVAKYSETIQFISVTATQESKLDDEIERITAEWKAFVLSTVPSTTTEGAIIFTDLVNK